MINVSKNSRAFALDKIAFILKPKPFRCFCGLSNWTSHCASNVHLKYDFS